MQFLLNYKNEFKKAKNNLLTQVTVTLKVTVTFLQLRNHLQWRSGFDGFYSEWSWVFPLYPLDKILSPVYFNWLIDISSLRAKGEKGIRGKSSVPSLSQTSHRLKPVGVVRVCCLKTLLKVALLLKPTARAMSSTVLSGCSLRRCIA